jgi:excisionase family DNA binding protein
MEEEYVTIVEAARRVGMSDKTVRRAIHDGKLAARYPQLNKAEVSITDLEAWHATLHVRPGET